MNVVLDEAEEVRIKDGKSSEIGKDQITLQNTAPLCIYTDQWSNHTVLSCVARRLYVQELQSGMLHMLQNSGIAPSSHTHKELNLRLPIHKVDRKFVTLC